MQQIKVIIGASYGDEGKGLATDHFAEQAAPSCITVLTNGGPQRGHTVEGTDGRRHVFKHFGSGTLRGAESYFGPMYMVNPMQFVKEYRELEDLDRAPRASVHPGCRFTTPYDVLLNQMQQARTGRHNSCGFGIWETVLRYQRGEGIRFGDFLAMDLQDREAYLRGLRDSYFDSRRRELGIGEEELWEVWYEGGLLRHYLEDCEEMRLLCPVREAGYLRGFGTVLLENAQGLLLDGRRNGEEDYTTPSVTGVGSGLGLIEGTFAGAEVEVCYVTRSYLTRHGDGPLEGTELRTRHEYEPLEGTELLKRHGDGPLEGVAPALPGVREDRTNPANRFQGRLRYGIMKDTGVLADRVERDYALCRRPASRNVYRPSVMVTHLNEYRGIDTDMLKDRFGTVYLSDGRTSRDIERA